MPRGASVELEAARNGYRRRMLMQRWLCSAGSPLKHSDDAETDDGAAGAQTVVEPGSRA